MLVSITVLIKLLFYRPGLLGKNKYAFAKTYCDCKYIKGSHGKIYAVILFKELFITCFLYACLLNMCLFEFHEQFVSFTLCSWSIEDPLHGFFSSDVFIWSCLANGNSCNIICFCKVVRIGFARISELQLHIYFFFSPSTLRRCDLVAKVTASFASLVICCEKSWIWSDDIEPLVLFILSLSS